MVTGLGRELPWPGSNASKNGTANAAISPAFVSNPSTIVTGCGSLTKLGVACCTVSQGCPAPTGSVGQVSVIAPSAGANPVAHPASGTGAAPAGNAASTKTPRPEAGSVGRLVGLTARQQRRPVSELKMIRTVFTAAGRLGPKLPWAACARSAVASALDAGAVRFCCSHVAWKFNRPLPLAEPPPPHPGNVSAAARQTSGDSRIRFKPLLMLVSHRTSYLLSNHLSNASCARTRCGYMVQWLRWIRDSKRHL